MKNLILRIVDMTPKVTRWLAIIASVCVAIMMVIVFIDIIGTKLFGRSVPGALDICEELMVVLTLLPLAHLAVKNEHISITLLGPHMSMTMRIIVQIIQYIIATLITAFITWRVYIEFLGTFRFMKLKGGLDLPIWPANLAIVIAFGFLTIVWILLLAKTLVLRSEAASI